MKKIDFEEINDYPAFKKLSSSLWRSNNEMHGAAIMIGAGFSRVGANIPSESYKPPLWHHLSKKLSSDLGSTNTNDPLMLAEEYNAYFGKKALYDLIGDQVNDPLIKPSHMHERMLKLPWAEIVTTNWDTLLERASKALNHPLYDVVKSQEDFANTRSPRIVKLHGTIGSTEELVFTQEDYRSYPEKNAAFVNFARQIFIENELCLLGFSGDDPNFLQWIGWVRDQLTTHARRIYIVGPLSLSPSKRKYLESINIIPIDLSDLVLEYEDLDDRYKVATQLFLDKLYEVKPMMPWEWKPKIYYEKLSFDSSNLEEVDELLSSLEQERLSYPGWVVCPHNNKNILSAQVDSIFVSGDLLKIIGRLRSEKLIYELVWRYSLTNAIVPSWLFEECVRINKAEDLTYFNQSQIIEASLLALRCGVWSKKYAKKLKEEKVKEKLYSLSSTNQGLVNELCYMDLCNARESLDYKYIKENICKIVEISPIWKIKKASLLSEIGRFDRSYEILTEAYKELELHYRDTQNSVFLLSRMTLCAMYIDAIDGFVSKQMLGNILSSKNIDLLCDPREELNFFNQKAKEKLVEQNNKNKFEPLFMAGAYKDNSKSITLSNELHPFISMYEYCYDTGLPYKLKDCTLLCEASTSLAELDAVDINNKLALILRSTSISTDKAIDKTFSRLVVARIDDSEVGFITATCLKAIEFWRKEILEGKYIDVSYGLKKLSVIIEMLARVTTRLSSDKAKEIYSLACEIGGDACLQCTELSSALDNLLKYSLESIPINQQYELFNISLKFPLGSEINIPNNLLYSWPNPIIEHVPLRSDSSDIDIRILELLNRVCQGFKESSLALERLLVLYNKNFLSDFEVNLLANRIWGKVDISIYLPKLGILDLHLLDLPCFIDIDLKKSISTALYRGFSLNDLDVNEIRNMVTASRIKNIYPDESLAPSIFDSIIAHKPQRKDLDNPLAQLLQISNPEHAYDKLMTYCIVPAMVNNDLTKDRFDKLVAWYRETSSPVLLPSFIYFLSNDSTRCSWVSDVISVELLSDNENNLIGALKSVLLWLKISADSMPRDVITSIVYLTCASKDSGLFHLLDFVIEMVKEGFLTVEEKKLLSKRIPILFESTDYCKKNLRYDEVGRVSLIRSKCVELTIYLIKSEYEADAKLIEIIGKARLDPLPEVRNKVLE
ncbi:SIR2 family NAD-dependent protein deacylase [Cobetia marina]|uniref:SIR2 family NAD-dependent protein deacylase n=1 Tax=Cobetia marina TaxID=28258 RepID=UPI0009FCCE60|nr:SIR2 family protein [Cobetia marina]